MAAVNDLVVASATVRDRKLFIRNRRAFDLAVSELREGWELEVTVKRRRAARSLLQNAYYWGVVVEMLSEHTGYTADEIHDFLKAKFIPKRLAVCDGNGVIQDEVVLGGSTREMNKVEFGEYVEAIQIWAAESLDVVIPDPNTEAAVSHVRADAGSRVRWYRAARRTA